MLGTFNPFLGYLGAISTLLVVFFFNTVSLWNRERRTLKAISALLSPALVVAIWMIKKLTRRDGGRFRIFVDLSSFDRFEGRLQALDDLIYPGGNCETRCSTQDENSGLDDEQP